MTFYQTLSFRPGSLFAVRAIFAHITYLLVLPDGTVPLFPSA